MMALYMPMQPSSKTPMMALSRRSSPASRLPSLLGLRRQLELAQAAARGSGRAAPSRPPASVRRPLRKNSSVKSSLHSVLYGTPALVSEAFRFSMPTRPGHCAAPVGHRQDRALVRVQPVQNVMAVLPDRLDHDQRRVRRNPAEDLHAVLLAVDESVPLYGVAGVPAAHVTAFAADGIHHGFFGLRLRRPAPLVGRQAQIPVRNHNYSVRHVSHCDMRTARRLG